MFHFTPGEDNLTPESDPGLRKEYTFSSDCYIMCNVQCLSSGYNIVFVLG